MRDTVEMPSETTAIEQAREVWMRGYRDSVEAGREVPVVDIPASLGDSARTSVEATTELARRARSRSWTVNVDIRALEAARKAKEAEARRSMRRPSRKRGRTK